MANKRTFFPEVETVWHKDYQTDYYRGVIIDQDDNIVERCRELRRSHYSAKKDAEEKWNRSPLYSGKSFAEIQRERAGTWEEKRGVWIQNTKRAYIQIIFIILAVIGLWGICGLLGGERGTLIGGMGAALCVIIGIPVSSRRQVTAFGTFIWDKNLYIVLLANENMSSASVWQDMGFPGVGLAVAMEGQVANAHYMNAVDGINKVLRISGQKTIWKISQIHEIEGIKKGVYRMKVSYYKYSNVRSSFFDKEKQVTFILRKSNFEAAEELISCLYYVKSRK